MSMSTLASTAFASWLKPLAKQRCRAGSHVAPKARHCRCCHCRCHLQVVVVIAAIPTIAEPTLSGEPSRPHHPVRRQVHFFNFFVVDCCIAATAAALLPMAPLVPLVWLVVTLPLIKRYLHGARNYRRSLRRGYCIVIYCFLPRWQGEWQRSLGGVYSCCVGGSGDD